MIIVSNFFLSECNSLFCYTVKFLILSICLSLFCFSLFLIASLFSNYRLLMTFDFFSLSTFYFSLSLSLSLSLHWLPIIFPLSLSPLATYHFPKFGNDSMTLNIHISFFMLYFVGKNAHTPSEL